MNKHPPYRFQIDDAILMSLLLTDIVAFSVGPAPRFHPCYFKRNDGTNWHLFVVGRDLEHKFETFTLGLEQVDRGGEASPRPSTHFQAWPFSQWTLHILLREEYLESPEGRIDSLGSAPLLQDAAPPGHIPDVALSSCIVAAGVLFSGDLGRQLLFGVDWAPYALFHTDDAKEIGAYLAKCQLMEVSDYVRSASASATS